MFGKRVACVLVSALVAVATGCSSSVKQLSFDTPEDAVAALVNQAATGDKEYGRQLFGPEVSDLSSGDPAVDAFERKRFVLAIEKRHDLRLNNDGTMDILIGDQGVAFPVPLERFNGRWMFNTPEGVERLADLRVGFYELRTLALLRSIPLAQQIYHSTDRDGDGLLEYAARLKSTEGKHDGLYWPTTDSEPNSPLGPFATEAEAPISATRGYQGYFGKLLTKSGAKSPGGVRSYMDSAGNLTGGYAVLAYPAVYGETGIMSFQMADDGVIYQKDLGPEGTRTAAETINEFDPSDGWTVTTDDLTD